VFRDEALAAMDLSEIKADVAALEGLLPFCGSIFIDVHIPTERVRNARPNMGLLAEYRKREAEFLDRAKDLDEITAARDAAKAKFDQLRKTRLEEFMTGFNTISSKLKEMYQVSLAKCLLRPILRSIADDHIGRQRRARASRQSRPILGRHHIQCHAPEEELEEHLQSIRRRESTQRSTFFHVTSITYVHVEDTELSCPCVCAACLQGKPKRSSLSTSSMLTLYLAYPAVLHGRD
jgi:hypothetical protein